jgi:UDP-arabinose 4-epimerase
MPNSSRAVLVTGGAGYIGSHTCKVLAKAGLIPVVFDNLVRGHLSAVRWGPFEQGDIADRQRLDSVIAKYRPVGAIHFAAYALVGESTRDPGTYYRNNVAGSLSLLEAMRDSGMDKIIFSSTCSTYGEPEQALINENHPQRPINAYGASKLMVERMLADFDAAHRLRSIALRYFNAAGADPDGEIGENHDPETHLIPLAIQTALGQRDELTVFGNDYDTPDGTCVRDYVHVSDLAEAHVIALRALIDGAETAAYNLGIGRGHSVQEVLGAVSRIAGRRFPVKNGPRRTGDPARLVADPSRAGAELGWRARITDLDEIVGTAWRWHQRAGHDRLKASKDWKHEARE